MTKNSVEQSLTDEQKKLVLASYDAGGSLTSMTRDFDFMTDRKRARVKQYIAEQRGEYFPESEKKLIQTRALADKLILDGDDNFVISRKTGMAVRTVRTRRKLLGKEPITVDVTAGLPAADIIKSWALGELSQRDLAAHYSTTLHAIKRVIATHKPSLDGRISYRAAKVLPQQDTGVRRYIFTCAQNNTKIHKKVWESLQLLAKHYDAEIFIASFNYNKAAYGSSAVKRNTSEDKDEGLWYADEIVSYLDKSDTRIQITPSLMWCGEVNLSPTLKRPLQGFEDYTQTHSSIFPHPRLSMKSIAAMSSGAKLCYTTGTITQRNYIQKGAGLKAEFHHSYGGLLVEVDASGSFFVRQLVATNNGCIQDLNVLVKNGKIESTTERVSAINWGDIHIAYLEKEQKELIWGEGGILDTLKPSYQFFHDTLDFRSKNHHDIKNQHSEYRKFLSGVDDVEQELKDASEFLHETQRKFCQSVVVESNHDNAFLRWLTNPSYDYRADPKNSIYFLECQLAYYKSMRRNDYNFNLLEWAVKQHKPLSGVKFLGVDESFVYRNIEFGIHGHSGANGSRGSAAGFAKLGFLCNVGHFHSAEILDGVYVSGVSASLDMEYNKGPSSWGHSHIVTYPNGNRAIITSWRGEWRAK